MVSFETYFFFGSKEKYDRKTEYKRPIKRRFFFWQDRLLKKNAFFLFFMAQKGRETGCETKINEKTTPTGEKK